MKINALLVLGTIGIMAASGPFGVRGEGTATSPPSLEALARQAIDPDRAVADAAIADLRRAGHAGLDALFKAHEALIPKPVNKGGFGGRVANDEVWNRLRTALDRVSGQRDDYASRLFWHTDLAEAEAAARATGKPILSLRLLGRLDEEYSCANSRFFRTTLYPNAQVASYLRDHFVLHWQSVRPIPRITIDFGDGRKIEETITGNSIHYVLAADGRVIDALPGLYGSEAFLRGLAAANDAAAGYASAPQAERNAFLKRYHRECLDKLSAAWKSDLKELAVNDPLREQVINDPNRQPKDIAPDDAIWTRVAVLHSKDAILDPGTQALVAAKNPPARDAALLAGSKSAIETPILRQIRSLRRSISEDTVRNEYRLHSILHEWLAAPAPGGLDQFNRRVYAQLFLTPDSDPWLGLAPADVFTGLENGGLFSNK